MVIKSQAAESSSQPRKSTRHKVQNWRSQLVTENWLWRVDRYLRSEERKYRGSKKSCYTRSLH